MGCHFLLQCLKIKSESEVAQSCLTLHDPMDCSLPGVSIHGIFQARVLEWVALAFSNLMLSLLVFCVVLLCITKTIPNRHRFYDIFFLSTHFRMDEF